MSIEELEYKHFRIPDEAFLSGVQHSLVSVEFAISVLEEILCNNTYTFGNQDIADSIENKIKELQKYLDENRSSNTNSI